MGRPGSDGRHPLSALAANLFPFSFPSLEKVSYPEYYLFRVFTWKSPEYGLTQHNSQNREWKHYADKFTEYPGFGSVFTAESADFQEMGNSGAAGSLSPHRFTNSRHLSAVRFTSHSSLNLKWIPVKSPLNYIKYHESAPNLVRADKFGHESCRAH